SVTAYNFYWWDPQGSGDWYYGTVYDDGTFGYRVGQTIQGPYNSRTEVSNHDGYYYIYSSDSVIPFSSGAHQAGEVRTRNYHDAQSGLNLTTYNQYYGYVSSQHSGLGYERDWIWNSGGNYVEFGSDFLEADYNVTAYDFYWWDPQGSGDWYYGTVYDAGM